MRKNVLIAVLLVSSVFLAAVPAGAPGGADMPTWNVGDSWSMGKKIDLAQYEQQMKDALTEAGAEGSIDLSGGIGFYITFKVEDDSFLVGDLECYKVSIKGALGINAKGDMSMTMDDPYIGDMEMKFSGTAVVDVWLDGFAYFSTEKLALKKVDLTIKAEFKIEGSYTIKMESMQQSGTMLLETSNVQMHIVVEYTPAMDLFDFPIEDGETWTVPDEETTETLSVTSSGTVRFKMAGIDDEIDLGDYDLEDTNVIDPDDTYSPEKITGKADKNGDKYNLGFTPEGYEFEGMPIDIPSTMPADPVLVYDPQEGFVSEVGVETGGEYTPMMEPTTEDQVNTFYASPSASVPGPGLDLLTMLLIIAVIVAVVIVVVAVVLVVRKRKKKAAAIPPPPQTTQMPGQPPQGYYPPQPQYPPQQYPPYPPPQYPPQEYPPQYPQSPPPGQ